MERIAYEFITKRDVTGFLTYREKTRCTICGFMPVAILLSMLPEDSQAHLIQYNTSGDLTGDWNNSVSYFSIAFSGVWNKGSEVKPNPVSTILTPEDKKSLLRLARRSLEYYLQHKRVVSVEQLGIPITEPMRQVRGSFVTLKCTLEHLQKTLGQEIELSSRMRKKIPRKNGCYAAVSVKYFPCNNYTVP